MIALVAMMAGVATAFGVWLLVLAVTGRVVVGGSGRSKNSDPSRGTGRGLASVSRSPRRSLTTMDSGTLAFVVVAVLLALFVLIVSKLVVAALGAALGVLLIPRVLAARAERRRAVVKMRAASEFVESIRGSLGAGSGLEAAIVEAAVRPPDGLASELASFVAYSRMPEVSIEEALRRLADDAGEPAIDLLVGSLLAALQGAAGDMGRLFERIADQGRDFADTRAQTQAERARVEFQTKILSLLVIGVGLLSVVVSPDLTAVYGPSASGQLLLAIPVAVFALGWWWLLRLNRVEGQYRFRLRSVRSPAAPDRLRSGALGPNGDRPNAGVAGVTS